MSPARARKRKPPSCNWSLSFGSANANVSVGVGRACGPARASSPGTVLARPWAIQNAGDKSVQEPSMSLRAAGRKRHCPTCHSAVSLSTAWRWTPPRILISFPGPLLGLDGSSLVCAVAGRQIGRVRQRHHGRPGPDHRIAAQNIPALELAGGQAYCIDGSGVWSENLNGAWRRSSHRPISRYRRTRRPP